MRPPITAPRGEKRGEAVDPKPWDRKVCAAVPLSLILVSHMPLCAFFLQASHLNAYFPEKMETLVKKTILCRISQKLSDWLSGL